MKSVKKICLFSDHHLSVNPRLWKEAFLYEKMGFDVVVYTMWQEDKLLQLDMNILKGHNIRYEPYLNLVPGKVNPLLRFCYRLQKKLATKLQSKLGIGTAWAISYSPGRMYRFVKKENADLYSAHLECAFLVGRRLIQNGKKVSYDFEDWYSKDYISRERPVKLLEAAETFAVQNAVFCTFPSNSMKQVILNKLEVADDKRFITIYNSFPAADVNDPNLILEDSSPTFRILWTSRTIGEGRGLEELIEALHYIEIPVEINLIGKSVPGYKEVLYKIWPHEKKHKLVIHDFMDHKELMRQMPLFDLGLAIENDYPDNKNLTVSNKILQYLQSGLPVLATGTAGQKEVAAFSPGMVFIVEPGKPYQWKNTLEEIIKTKTSCKNVDSSMPEVLSWNTQEEKLVKIITSVL